jgi:mannitol-1-/sugar-/sorbitol-6-phosphatase
VDLTNVDAVLFDAVLFDMDGTLVDSDAAVERAWTTWAREYGVDVDPATLHGRPADATVRSLCPGLDDAAVEVAAARQLDLQYDDLADVVPTPGALDLLARLTLPWAVVPSADARLAHARLGAAGITAPVLVNVEDISRGKPDPEGYLLAAQLLGVPPGRCLVVEDAPAGVAAGRAAGATVAALKGVEGDVSITDLTELARLIDLKISDAGAGTCTPSTPRPTPPR